MILYNLANHSLPNILLTKKNKEKRKRKQTLSQIFLQLLIFIHYFPYDICNPDLQHVILLSFSIKTTLWCWRRLLRVPWTTRRSNQSILKEISPGCSLEGLMLKLKLQYFGHLMRRVDSLGKTLMLGGIGGRRRRGWQRMRWLDEMASPTRWTWVWVNSRS